MPKTVGRAPLLTLALDPSATAPLFRQLYDGLRSAILGGTLPPGTHLPATPRPFRPGVPSVAAFPFELWAKLVARHGRHPTETLLGYGDPAGYRPLREAVTGYLRTARAVRCEADQVVIVNGSQQALDLAARL